MPGKYPCMQEVDGLLRAEKDVVQVWSFQGEMGQDQLDLALLRANEACDRAGDAKQVRKRLISVLVECLENILRHGMDSGPSTAVLVRSGKAFRLVVGNEVQATTAAMLDQRVRILNQMDEHDLREQYLKLLNDPARTEQGGAGLGLFTIARKTSTPVKAYATSIDGQRAQFCMELTVGLA